MSSDNEFDKYLNNLDSEDQQVLNEYMDNLDLEYNPQLDEYLDRIEEQNKPEMRSSIWNNDSSETDNEDKSQDVIQNTTQDANPEDEHLEVRNDAKAIAEVIAETAERYDEDVDPLQVSLLDGDFEPYVDTLRYKDEPEPDSKKNKKKNLQVNNAVRPDNNYDDVLYIDNIPKKRGLPVFITVILVLLILGGGGFAVYRYTNLLDFVKKQEAEATTELVVTTEATTEEATTEELPGPYATVDYTLHDPHTTNDTIVYDSNPYSLRYPQEEWPLTRDEDGNEREATQEDLYPTIALEAVEGSLNSTSPNPDNLAETQVMTSRYMVLVDLADDSIVAKRDSDVVINPASMTKILTVLTAVDMIDNLDDTFKITHEDVRYAMENDCSAVGFLEGETVTVRDLIYGTIVCSGADAAVGLAEYCCGGQDAFVEKMNEKAEELGISDTAHFTNVVGVYDENLHCTMEDMAVIISTAVQNELLADVLNTRIYQTTPDPNIVSADVYNRIQVGEDGTLTLAPKDDAGTGDNNEAEAGEETGEETTGDDAAGDNDAGDNAEDTGNETGDDITDEDIERGVLQVAKNGIQISNMFMRRIEDKDTGGEVLGAKTGFVNAAGFCCASYYKSNSGKEYVCVTGDTYSSWRCIYDHVGIYRSLAK